MSCQQGDKLEDNPSARLSNNCNLLSLNLNLFCIALNVSYIHFALSTSVHIYIILLILGGQFCKLWFVHQQPEAHRSLVSYQEAHLQVQLYE